MFEAMAALRCARAFAKLCSGKRVLLECDNASVVRGIRKCYSPTASMMDLIGPICEVVALASVHLRVAPIKGSPIPPTPPHPHAVYVLVSRWCMDVDIDVCVLVLT